MTDARPKRVLAEVHKLQASATDTDPSSAKFLLDKSPLDDQASASSNIILGRILPNSDIYNQAGFQIEIKLTPEYPFKPPELRFITPIYHPSVDKDGKICVDIINGSEQYNPTTPLLKIVKAIVDLIDNPQIDHSLNAGKFGF
jgi:ubiquitin-protein ligase